MFFSNRSLQNLQCLCPEFFNLHAYRDTNLEPPHVLDLRGERSQLGQTMYADDRHF